jgi:hypothetical protein
MMQLLSLGRPMAGLLTGVMLASALPVGGAQARLVGVEQVLDQLAGQDDRGRVQQFLSRADVRDQLVRLGVDPAEAEARVALLSDAEISRIASQIDQLPAGQGIIETLLMVTLVVFLVLLLTDILGFTDVYPFVKKTANPSR